MRVILGVTLAGGLLAACAPTPPAVVPDAPKRCDAEASKSLIGSHVGAVSFPPSERRPTSRRVRSAP